MNDTLALLFAANARLSFLPPEAAEIFEGCFDLRVCEVPRGGTLDTAGALCYLCSGTGRIGKRRADPGVFFGVDAEGKPRAEAFAASEDSVLLRWDGDVLSHVCYRACWFHVRLLNEVRGGTQNQLDNSAST